MLLGLIADNIRYSSILVIKSDVLLKDLSYERFDNGYQEKYNICNILTNI